MLLKKKIICVKITEFLIFEILQFLSYTVSKVCKINFSYSFYAISLKLRINVTGILKICTFLFEERKKKTFFTKLQHFWTLKFYSFWLKHYGKYGYYDQLFLQFRTNVTGILKMCISLSEVNKAFLTKLQHFWTLKFYCFRLKHYGKFVYCDQLFLQL